MISLASFRDELEKIAGEFHGFELASNPLPAGGARPSRAGVGVSGGGFNATRGGFLLSSGVQGNPIIPLSKQSEFDVPYNPKDFKKAKLAALKANMHIGKTPNQFGAKGPSIAQVSKPFGFGRAGAIPGTDKSGKI